MDEGGIVEHPQHEALSVLPITIENKLGTCDTLVEGPPVEDGSFEVAEVPPQVMRQLPEVGVLQFILVLAGRSVMLEGVVQQRDKKFGSVCRRDKGEARLCDRAHLVESPVLHGVLRRDDIVTEIAAQPLPVFLYIKISLPGMYLSGETPCLTIKKLSKPSPTVIHALSYLFAKTVGSHRASRESSNKNRTS